MNKLDEILEHIKNHENRFYLISDDLEDYYYDYGSFSNIYHVDDKIIKIFYDKNDYKFLEQFIHDKNKQKLREIMDKLHYPKDYNYVQFIVDEIKKESEKLNDLKSLSIFPNIYQSATNYICMEIAKGRPLFALLDEEREEIPLEAWTRLIETLQKVVEIGYRPNDLSQNNIFWSKEDNCFYLIDVGLYFKEYPTKLHTPLIFKDERYKEIFESLKMMFEFDLEYEEFSFNE